MKLDKHLAHKIYAGIALLLVLSVFAVVWPWIHVFSSSAVSQNPADWGVFGDYIGGVLSTLISVFAFVGIIITISVQGKAIKAQQESIELQLRGLHQEKTFKDDELYSRQALECLRGALSVLHDPESGLLRKRLAWLEAARLIITAKELAESIQTESMKKIYKVNEKLIRSDFGNKLDVRVCPATIQAEFFDGPDWNAFFDDVKPERIEVYSVYVVYSFSSWQSNEEDILDSVRGDLDVNKVSMSYFGARQFIQNEKNRAKPL